MRFSLSMNGEEERETDRQKEKERDGWLSN